MEKDVSAYSQSDSFLGRLSFSTHSFAAQVMLSIMSGVIVLEVVSRYFFRSGLTWSQEICGLAFFLMVFLCQSNTWQADRHIRMDIFYNNFRGLGKIISDALTIICGGIFYSSLIFEGLRGLRYQFMVNEGTMELELPMWPFTAVMVFGCLLTLVLLARFTFIKLFRRQS